MLQIFGSAAVMAAVGLYWLAFTMDGARAGRRAFAIARGQWLVGSIVLVCAADLRQHVHRITR